MANDRKLLEHVYFLKRFQCHLQRSEFEVLTDIQTLQNFFQKSNQSRPEACWLDLLGYFAVSKRSLVKGRMRVLSDALSRAF